MQSDRGQVGRKAGRDPGGRGEKKTDRQGDEKHNRGRVERNKAGREKVGREQTGRGQE